MRFLVIEDTASLNMAICDTLKSLGTAETALDGEEGLFKASEGSYDLIVLDLMLPKMNGMDVLKNMRKREISTPVLILTAKGQLEDKVEGLKEGADDYMVKPFARDELIARVESILRRYNRTLGNGYQFKDLKIEFTSKTVTIGGENVIISGKLYDILEYMVRNKNIIISKEQLFDRIWGFESETIYTVTEVYVSNLRKILDKYDYKKYLKTIKTIGYMWSEKEDG